MNATLDYQPAVKQPESKAMIWTGRVLSALPVLLMLGGGIAVLFNHAMLLEGMKKYSYPEMTAWWIFGAEMICVLLYIIPQTAVLGAILLTGYLGGATATHVRAGEPFIFPVIIGVVLWLGLYLRDARIRALVPLRQ
jgi:hypothetical protein